MTTTHRYRYLIVGGGMTADAAAHGIRDVDPTGTLGMIAGEPPPPDNRPPLSKGLWKGEPEAGIWRDTDATGAELHRGRRVVGIDVTAKQVTDDAGDVYGYERLLLATGGTPRRLPIQSDQIIYFRTYDDYRRLRGIAQHPVRLAVIGGGFIGAAGAAALRPPGRGGGVVMLVREKVLGARVFPADLSAFLADYYRQKGVEMLTGEGMTGLEARGGKVGVRTTTGKGRAGEIGGAG